jgi:hypothetical protein
MCQQVGCSVAPALLRDLWDAELITRAELCAALPDVWRYGGRPVDQCLSRTEWYRLFRATGYTYNGEPVWRPSGPVRLFRGSTHAGRFGMAWTTSRKVALTYAMAVTFEYVLGGVRPDRMHVFVVEFKPRDLLAALDVPPVGKAYEFVVTPGAARARGVDLDPYGELIMKHSRRGIG